MASDAAAVVACSDKIAVIITALPIIAALAWMLTALALGDGAH